MREQLASVTGAPTGPLERLYARWARGGAGLLITGNVMIDALSIGEPRNIGTSRARQGSGTVAA